MVMKLIILLSDSYINNVQKLNDLLSDIISPTDRNGNNYQTLCRVVNILIVCKILSCCIMTKIDIYSIQDWFLDCLIYCLTT